jgi:hypothetical protein
MQTLLFWQAKVDKSGQTELNLPISLVSSKSVSRRSEMSAQNERTSATIYQFPVRGRFANQNGYAQEKDALPTAAIGSAWYHDEAMKEEQKAKTRKH